MITSLFLNNSPPPLFYQPLPFYGKILTPLLWKFEYSTPLHPSPHPLIKGGGSNYDRIVLFTSFKLFSDWVCPNTPPYFGPKSWSSANWHNLQKHTFIDTYYHFKVYFFKSFVIHIILDKFSSKIWCCPTDWYLALAHIINKCWL